MFVWFSSESFLKRKVTWSSIINKDHLLSAFFEPGPDVTASRILPHLILTTARWSSTVIVPFLQMEKQRHRMANCLPGSHCKAVIEQHTRRAACLKQGEGRVSSGEGVNTLSFFLLPHSSENPVWKLLIRKPEDKLITQVQDRIKCDKGKYFNSYLVLEKERQICRSQKQAHDSQPYGFMGADAMGTLGLLSLDTGPQSGAGLLMSTTTSIIRHDLGPM